ncbi:sugar ABC transporter substrate-binding protein [Castellaniella sp. UC4442_H9]|jgi:ribose transport system substrate-binding protein
MSTGRRSRFILSAVVAGAVGLTAVMPAGAATSHGTIGVSVPTVEGPFFTSMLYGILKQAKEEGYAVKILSANGYGNVATQVSQIENLISGKVDIMLVDPADPNVTKRPIQEAVKSGIIVLGAGDPAPGALGSVSASHCTVGQDLAVGAKKLLPDGGTVGVLAGPAGAHWSTERLRCFKEDLKGTKIKIVAERTSEPAVAEGLSIASDFLQRFPDLDMLYGADDTVGDGAAKAVEAANRCGKTKVLTAVLGEQAEELTRKGCINYDVALQPVLMGVDAVKLGIAIRNGKKPAVTEISIPNLPVTPENIDSVNKEYTRSPKGWRPPL